MRTAGAIAAAALMLLAGCATADGRGGDREAPVGRAARAAHGADPLATPPTDAGQAEDPKGG